MMTTEKPTASQYFTAWALDTTTAPFRIYRDIYQAERPKGQISAAFQAASGGVMANVVSGLFGMVSFIPAAVICGSTGLDPLSSKALAITLWGVASSQFARFFVIRNSRLEALRRNASVPRLQANA